MVTFYTRSYLFPSPLVKRTTTLCIQTNSIISTRLLTRGELSRCFLQRCLWVSLISLRYPDNIPMRTRVLVLEFAARFGLLRKFAGGGYKMTAAAICGANF